MNMTFTFPFGQQVQLVEQQDKTPKKVFVLGVYASAVHARWVRKDGSQAINALAVASEPYIFWRGENAEALIASIQVPEALGKLMPAARNLNGPSGRALDDLFLTPMGLSRDETWLCDLVPHSCLNSKQKAALEREYEPLRADYNLPRVTLPPVPKPLATPERQAAILEEVDMSQAETLVLLGDEPIKWFLNAFDKRWKSLSDFGETAETYGKPQEIRLNDKPYEVIALTHPRQAARLGGHSIKWHTLHQTWLNQSAT